MNAVSVPEAADPEGRHLPGVLGEIAEVAGEAAAVKIALRWGGQHFYFPRARTIGLLPETHAFVNEVGRRAARALAKHYDGEVVYIPRARKKMAAVLLKRGNHPSEVARQLGVTHRSVERYAASLTGPDTAGRS